VAHQIVWLSDELLTLEAAHQLEGRIAVRDDALGIGGRYQHGIGGEAVFLGGDG
jgi:hypothetical protein